ncbi:MAG: hypothetical protein DRP30_01130 [Thermotoga sp.]|nr:MAG: hypothetical protein DRP30_01130 [Thermotoga sp.]
MRMLMNKIEAYFLKEFREKSLVIVILFTMMFLIPANWFRFFFMLLIISSLLPRDVHHGRVHLLSSLPFSRSDLFWISYILATLIGISTSLVTSTIWFLNSGDRIVSMLIFSSAYFGICMLSVSFGLDHFVIPLFVFFGGGFMGSLGTSTTNPYSLVSPVYQGSKLGSLVFSLLILIVSWIIFERKGAPK